MIQPPPEETPAEATPQQVPPQLTIEALQRTISQGALTTKEAATIYATISGQSHKFTRARGGETAYLDFTLWTPQQKLAWCDTMRAFGRWIKASGKRTADYGLEKWWLYRKEYVQSIYAEAKGV